MLFYRPEPDIFVSDLWCLRKDDLWYVYGCQDNGIGVATSPDLTDYTFQGIAIPGNWYGGDAFRWKGKHYMIYSEPVAAGAEAAQPFQARPNSNRVASPSFMRRTVPGGTAPLVL